MVTWSYFPSPQQENRKRHGSTRSVVDMELDDPDDGDDNAPLFYQPGKRGFYSPRPGKNTEARLNCFRNIGRSVLPAPPVHSRFPLLKVMK